MPRRRKSSIKVEVNRLYEDTYIVSAEDGGLRAIGLMRPEDVITLRDRLIGLFPLDPS